jgi:hypothetical protein
MHRLDDQTRKSFAPQVSQAACTKSSLITRRRSSDGIVMRMFWV